MTGVPACYFHHILLVRGLSWVPATLKGRLLGAVGSYCHRGVLWGLLTDLCPRNWLTNPLLTLVLDEESQNYVIFLSLNSWHLFLSFLRRRMQSLRNENGFSSFTECKCCSKTTIWALFLDLCFWLSLIVISESTWLCFSPFSLKGETHSSRCTWYYCKRISGNGEWCGEPTIRT